MTLDHPDGAGPELVDPYDGRIDLVARRLRTPLAPEISFEDDRYACCARRASCDLGFEPTPPSSARSTTCTNV